MTSEPIFRTRFKARFDPHRRHDGQAFTPLGEVDRSEYEFDMKTHWIRLEDGTKIKAEPKECTFNIDTILRHYLVCALWSSTYAADGNQDGNDCTPVDEDFDVDDVHPDDVKEQRGIIADFVAANAADLSDGAQSDEQIGHDFWLTRNGHGAGFWDRGLGDVGNRLTAACKPYGSAYVLAEKDNPVVRISE